MLLGTDSGLVALPMTGGTPQVLMQGTDPYSTSVAPGDDRVACCWNNRMAFEVRGLSGEIDSLTVGGGGAHLWDVAWSPYGNAVAVLTSDGQRRYTLRLVGVRARAARVLLEDSVRITSVVWNGAAGAIYYVRAGGTSGQRLGQLWKLPVTAAGVPTGRPTMVLPMLDSWDFSVADDGTLAYLRETGTENVWEAALAGDTTRRWLTRGTGLANRPRYSPDGRSIAFVRSEGATTNLWVTRSDAGEPEQLTFLEEGTIRDYAWSPDGRRIAFCRKGEAAPAIGIVSVAGGAGTRPATLSVSDNCDVGWLSSEEVLYLRPSSGSFGVLSLRGQPARQLVASDSAWRMYTPRADPTGRVVAVLRYRLPNGRPGLWLISPADSSLRLLRSGAIPLRWAANGEALYVREIEAPVRFLRIPLAVPDSATTVTPPHGCLDDISPDGTRVLCVDWTSASSDVWLIRNFDPTASPAPAPRRR